MSESANDLIYSFCLSFRILFSSIKLRKVVLELKSSIISFVFSLEKNCSFWQIWWICVSCLKLISLAIFAQVLKHAVSMFVLQLLTTSPLGSYQSIAHLNGLPSTEQTDAVLTPLNEPVQNNVAFSISTVKTPRPAFVLPGYITDLVS